MKRRLMNIAWSVADKFDTFSEALKYAWSVIKLQWTMLVGAVSFEYRKVDGSIRKAVGTLDIPYERVGNRPANKGVFVYWDVEANGFRSCKLENIIF